MIKIRSVFVIFEIYFVVFEKVWLKIEIKKSWKPYCQTVMQMQLACP